MSPFRVALASIGSLLLGCGGGPQYEGTSLADHVESYFVHAKAKRLKSDAEAKKLFDEATEFARVEIETAQIAQVAEKAILEYSVEATPRILSLVDRENLAVEWPAITRTDFAAIRDALRSTKEPVRVTALRLLYEVWPVESDVVDLAVAVMGKAGATRSEKSFAKVLLKKLGERDPLVVKDRASRILEWIHGDPKENVDFVSVFGTLKASDAREILEPLLSPTPEQLVKSNAYYGLRDRAASVLRTVGFQVISNLDGARIIDADR